MYTVKEIIEYIVETSHEIEYCPKNSQVKWKKNFEKDSCKKDDIDRLLFCICKSENSIINTKYEECILPFLMTNYMCVIENDKTITDDIQDDTFTCLRNHFEIAHDNIYIYYQVLNEIVQLKSNAQVYNHLLEDINLLFCVLLNIYYKEDFGKPLDTKNFDENSFIRKTFKYVAEDFKQSFILYNQIYCLIYSYKDFYENKQNTNDFQDKCFHLNQDKLTLRNILYDIYLNISQMRVDLNLMSFIQKNSFKELINEENQNNSNNDIVNPELENLKDSNKTKNNNKVITDFFAFNKLEKSIINLLICLICACLLTIIVILVIYKFRKRIYLKKHSWMNFENEIIEGKLVYN